MATERQLLANRANSALSTGPRTDAGKEISRLNALKHGLAATTCAALMVGPNGRAHVDERRSLLAKDFRPADSEQRWQFEELVIASIRIERCRDTFFALCREHGERARLVWEGDRRSEVADLAAGLRRNPSGVACRLEASMQGADHMIHLWNGLLARLDRHGDWTEPQRALALDLLGIHPTLRDAETPLDPAEGDVLAIRKALVSNEINRLTALRDGPLTRLDARNRAMAEETLGAELTKPLQLLDRYERAANARFDSALKSLLKAAKTSAVAKPPTPVAKPIPEPVRRPADPAKLNISASPMPASPPPPARVEPPRALNRHQRRALAAQQRRA